MGSAQGTGNRLKGTDTLTLRRVQKAYLTAIELFWSRITEAAHHRPGTATVVGQLAGSAKVK